MCVCTPTCLYLCPNYGQPAVADSCVYRTASVYVRARAHFVLQQMCVLCLFVCLRAAVLSQVMILGADWQAGRRPQRRLLGSEGSQLAGSWCVRTVNLSDSTDVHTAQRFQAMLFCPFVFVQIQFCAFRLMKVQ